MTLPMWLSAERSWVIACANVFQFCYTAQTFDINSKIMVIYGLNKPNKQKIFIKFSKNNGFLCCFMK